MILEGKNQAFAILSISGAYALFMKKATEKISDKMLTENSIGYAPGSVASLIVVSDVVESIIAKRKSSGWSSSGLK